MTDKASPVGRYEPAAIAGHADIPLHEVHLLGVPVNLFLATRQQHDDVLREFAVVALDDRIEAGSTPPELRRLVRDQGRHFVSTGIRTEDDIDAAVRAGASTIDLTYQVSSSVIEGADRLESLMASADEFCSQGRMLTMARTPEMVRFAGWWLGELRRQVAGHPPIAWSDFAGA